MLSVYSICKVHVLLQSITMYAHMLQIATNIIGLSSARDCRAFGGIPVVHEGSMNLRNATETAQAKAGSCASLGVLVRPPDDLYGCTV